MGICKGGDGGKDERCVLLSRVNCCEEFTGIWEMEDESWI